MSDHEDPPTDGSRPHAVGTVGIVFFVLAFAAPLAAIAGVAPIVFGTACSVGAPGIYADAPFEVYFDNIKVTSNQ